MVSNPPTALQRRARWIAAACAIALGASIPVSTALDNVLLGLLLLTWLASGLILATAKLSIKINYLRASTGLFVLLAVGTLYGAAPLRDALGVLGKYADLLAIPILAILLADDALRRKALLAFAFSVALTVLLSWALWLRVLPAWPVFVWDGISPSVFKYKATHNILVSFGTFLFVWLAVDARDRNTRAAWLAMAVLAAANVLFLVNGATGYLIMAALTVLFVVQHLRRRLAAIALLAVVCTGVALVTLPNPVRERVLQIVTEASAWHPERASTGETSTGVRLEFYQNTLPIIAAHPLLGVGTGGFARAYAQQVDGTAKARSTNPHSEFLGITAQLGAFGLALFILLWCVQWRVARDLPSLQARGLMQGLVVAMVIGCSVNSLLLDHTEGLFYAWLSGVLLSGVQFASRPGESS